MLRALPSGCAAELRDAVAYLSRRDFRDNVADFSAADFPDDVCDIAGRASGNLRDSVA